MLFGKFVPDCVRSNLRGSKFKIFFGGACPQTPLVGMHAYARVNMLSRYYHPATILFPPPNSKSCMKPCTYMYIELNKNWLR